MRWCGPLRASFLRSKRYWRMKTSFANVLADRAKCGLTNSSRALAGGIPLFDKHFQISFIEQVDRIDDSSGIPDMNLAFHSASSLRASARLLGHAAAINPLQRPLASASDSPNMLSIPAMSIPPWLYVVGWWRSWYTRRCSTTTPEARRIATVVGNPSIVVGEQRKCRRTTLKGQRASH